MAKGLFDNRKIPPEKVFKDPQLRLSISRIPDHGSGPTQHSHGFSEIVVIVDGCGIHHVEDERYAIEAGDVFVLLGDTKHGYEQTKNLYLINILFDAKQLGMPLADLGSLPGYHALFMVEPRIRRQQKFSNRLRLKMAHLSHAVKLITEAEDELVHRQRGYRFAATTYLMRLICYLSRCYSELEQDTTRPVAQLSELLGYMERHYAEPLTVEDLTEVANMSQTTLMRKFKEIMKRTPIDYLIRLRITKARELLRSSPLAVSEISFEVGFADSNYFARQFKRVTGASPRQYRQRRDARGK